MENPDSAPADILYGVPAIASHMRLKEPAVRHLIRSAGLPSFKVGGRVCARPSRINSWLAEREAAARTPKPKDGDHD